MMSRARGVVSLSDSASVGEELATTVDAEATPPWSVPSNATTSTSTVWPRSPLPAKLRSKDDEELGPLAWDRMTPLTVHVNAYVSASPSASDDVVEAVMT